MKPINSHLLRWGAEQIKTWESDGTWANCTLAERVQQLAQISPDLVTHIDGDEHLTVGSALSQAESLAAKLMRLGYVAGDVLAFEIPNWHEAVVIDIATSLLGLVACPIVPIYRDREVEQILLDANAKGIFVAHEFRGFDYLEMMTRIQSKLPKLQNIWTVRGHSPSVGDLKDMVTETGGIKDWPKISPHSVKLVLYTSGTTGRAKAVLHTHNTLGRVIVKCMEVWSLVPEEKTFMPSPVTHVTGFAFGIEMPFFGGGPCVFLDKWDPSIAIDIIQKHQVAFMLCATPFMQELLNLCEAQKLTLPSMRLFPCGGAAIPPELIYRVRRSLTNCTAFRLYGSSEAPLITLGYFKPGQEKLAAETDGEAYDYEVKVVNEEGLRAEPGQEGEICARGPSVFLGYANEEDNKEAFDHEGFFHSGDLGVLNAIGSLVFTGRIKDLINRGGEKISAKEVEDLLHDHPCIQEASVVAMPHERLGETVCAYVIAKNGQTLESSEILRFLENEKVAKQKLPEKFIFVTEFPKTPSGKVKKDLLRMDVIQRLKNH